MRSHVDHPSEYADFTEGGYRALLDLAKSKYRFARFGDQGADRHVLWRHDLDASVHRALRLAEIEREKGVTATYFVYLRCRYYNPLSTEVSRQLSQILAMGHDIALHFDPTHYGQLDRAELESAITMEREILAAEFGVSPVAVSFHLFGILTEPMPSESVVCNMINAYGADLRATYGYVSDSNGLWLHRRLHDVLADGGDERLQVLTHPEWWTPEAMPPRARLQRAIDGYARFMGEWYDQIVDKSGRPNLR